jgi:hypothetical protein
MDTIYESSLVKQSIRSTTAAPTSISVAIEIQCDEEEGRERRPSMQMYTSNDGLDESRS